MPYYNVDNMRISLNAAAHEFVPACVGKSPDSSSTAGYHKSFASASDSPVSVSSQDEDAIVKDVKSDRPSDRFPAMSRFTFKPDPWSSGNGFNGPLSTGSTSSSTSWDDVDLSPTSTDTFASTFCEAFETSSSGGSPGGSPLYKPRDSFSEDVDLAESKLVEACMTKSKVRSIEPPVPMETCVEEKSEPEPRSEEHIREIKSMRQTIEALTIREERAEQRHDETTEKLWAMKETHDAQLLQLENTLEELNIAKKKMEKKNAELKKKAEIHILDITLSRTTSHWGKRISQDKAAQEKADARKAQANMEKRKARLRAAAKKTEKQKDKLITWTDSRSGSQGWKKAGGSKSRFVDRNSKSKWRKKSSDDCTSKVGDSKKAEECRFSREGTKDRDEKKRSEKDRFGFLNSRKNSKPRGRFERC